MSGLMGLKGINTLYFVSLYYTLSYGNETLHKCANFVTVIGGNNIYISMAIITNEKCTEGASWRRQIIDEVT